MALKNTCEALCFPVEKFAMGNTNLFFSRWGKKHYIACLLSYFEIISNVEQSCMKSSLYPSPRSNHICFISAFPETSENWLQRSEPLSPRRHAWEDKDGLSCIPLYNCSSVIKFKRSNWDSRMDYNLNSCPHNVLYRKPLPPSSI